MHRRPLAALVSTSITTFVATLLLSAIIAACVAFMIGCDSDETSEKFGEDSTVTTIEQEPLPDPTEVKNIDSVSQTIGDITVSVDTLNAYSEQRQITAIGKIIYTGGDAESFTVSIDAEAFTPEPIDTITLRQNESAYWQAVWRAPKENTMDVISGETIHITITPVSSDALFFDIPVPSFSDEVA